MNYNISHYFPISQLPVLEIIIPIISSCLCIIFRKSSYPLFISFISFIFTLSISIILFHFVKLGDMQYFMGGFISPIGIEYKVDLLNSVMLILINVVCMMILFYGYGTVFIDIQKEKIYLFYAIFMLYVIGLMGTVISNDLFNIYVFIEISSLSSYSLTSMGKDKRCLIASFQYLIIGTIASSFILIGIGMFYMITGTLNLTDMSEVILNIDNHLIIKVGTSFIVVGLLMKAGFFPLYWWIPNIYKYAPSFFSIILAALSTKIPIYLLIRFTYSIFDTESLFSDNDIFKNIFIISGYCGVIFGSISAIYQDSLKKIIAFSTIAATGYLIPMLINNSELSDMSMIIFIINDIMLKAAIFMIISYIENKIGTDSISKLQGLFKYMPFSSVYLLICLLSLIGLPLTLGFISKWYLLEANLQYNIFIMIMIIIWSLFSLVYTVKIISKIFFTTSKNNDIYLSFLKEKDTDVGFYGSVQSMCTSLSLWIVLILSLYMGIDKSLSVDVARNIVGSLNP